MSRRTTAAARITRYFRSEAGHRITRRVPAAVVFAVAAYQSYWHTVEVTHRAGESAVTAHIMPLSVDGLMIVAARYITEAKTMWGKALSFVAFLAGMAATGAANYLAADPNPFARAVALWPAIALVLTAAMLHWGERPARKAPRARRTPAQSAQPARRALRAAA